MQSQMDTGKLGQTFFPKQADIDKVQKIMQRKVLRGTHLPAVVNEIQTGYLSSQHILVIYPE